MLYGRALPLATIIAGADTPEEFDVSLGLLENGLLDFGVVSVPRFTARVTEPEYEGLKGTIFRVDHDSTAEQTAFLQRFEVTVLGPNKLKDASVRLEESRAALARANEPPDERSYAEIIGEERLAKWDNRSPEQKARDDANLAKFAEVGERKKAGAMTEDDMLEALADLLGPKTQMRDAAEASEPPAPVEVPIRPWNERAAEFEALSEDERAAIWTSLDANEFLFAAREEEANMTSVVYITPKSYFEAKREMWQGPLNLRKFLDGGYEEVGCGHYHCAYRNLNTVIALLNHMRMRENMTFDLWVNSYT